MKSKAASSDKQKEIQKRRAEIVKQITDLTKQIEHLKLDLEHVQLDCPHLNKTSSNTWGRWESTDCEDCGKSW